MHVSRAQGKTLKYRKLKAIRHIPNVCGVLLSVVRTAGKDVSMAHLLQHHLELKMISEHLKVQVGKSF